MRILICEDDEKIILLLRNVFEMENVIFDVSTNCEDCKRLFDSNDDYSCVILDYWIDNCTAEEMVNFIRQKSKVPILLISATENIDKKAETLNLKHYLKKPFRVDVLIEKINTLNKQYEQQYRSNR